MEHGKFYTAEALKGLNAAYDAEYGITSLETDKVNGIIRCMDDTRKLSLVPQEGDLLEYFPQNGDYFPQAHIETAGKDRAAVCLSSRTPFCHMENGHVHYTTEGGPLDTASSFRHDACRHRHKTLPDLGTSRQVPPWGAPFPHARTLMVLPRAESTVRRLYHERVDKIPDREGSRPGEKERVPLPVRRHHPLFRKGA